MDLNSISSNLLLVGLILIGLCCLYLLYSNFSKVREIEDLKRRVEDLKKIFINQQNHNDETFSKINTILFQTLGQTPISTTSPHPAVPSDRLTVDNKALATPESVNNEIAKDIMLDVKAAGTTKTVNIDEANAVDNGIINKLIINKEGYEQGQEQGQSAGGIERVSNTKEINIDLHDLDDLDDAEIQDNENCEEIDIDNMVAIDGNAREHDIDIQNYKNKEDGKTSPEVTKDNIFNLDVINNINAEIFDDLEDTLSIATEPIGDSNDVINTNANFNIDDINDIDDLDIDIPNDTIATEEIEPSEIDTTDLDEILNGNQTKKTNLANTKTEKELVTRNEIGTENIKKIELETHMGSDVTALNNMSVKQLKDLAKSHKLKTTGTKQELIDIILASGIIIQ